MLASAATLVCLVGLLAGRSDAQPSLSSPSNGAVEPYSCVTLTWAYCSGCSPFTVYLGTNSSTLKLVNTTSEYTITVTVSAGTHYWLVGSSNGNSSVRYFRTCSTYCAPEVVSNVVSDPSFEKQTPWTVTNIGSTCYAIINATATAKGKVSAHTGTNLVLFGAQKGISCTVYVNQTFVIPTTAKYIFFWAAVVILPVDKLSYMEVQIDSEVFYKVTYANTNTALTLQAKVYSLPSTIADGKSHTLSINGHEDIADGNTTFNGLLDDITIGDCTAFSSSTDCSAFNSKCQWCEYSQSCIDVSTTCPGCSVASGDDTCCASTTGCTFCYNNAKCQITGTECVNCASSAYTSDSSCPDGDCYWCGTSKSCLNATNSSSCPSCTLYTSASQCATSDTCAWCNSTGKCLSTSTSCPLCSKLAKTNCSSSPGCHWCLTGTICRNLTEQCADCSSGTTSNCTGDCSWCSSTETCKSTTASCPACLSYGSNSSCKTAPGCSWCSIGYCENDSSTCRTCLGNSQSSCTSPCQWCGSTQQCVNPSAACPSCGAQPTSNCTTAYPGCQICSSTDTCNLTTETCKVCKTAGNTSSSCGAMSGCKWCSETAYCEVSDGTCTLCSNKTTSATCASPCSWCSSSLLCQTSSVSCTSCYSMSAASTCYALPGCKMCNSTATCNTTSETCMSCTGLSKTSCVSALLPGCCWDGSACREEDSNGICPEQSSAEDNGSSGTPSWVWIIIGVGGGAVVIGLGFLSLGLAIRRKKRAPNLPMEMKQDSAFMVMPDGATGTGIIMTNTAVSAGSVQSGGMGITSGYINSGLQDGRMPPGSEMMMQSIGMGAVPIGVVVGDGQMLPSPAVIMQPPDNQPVVYQDSSYSSVNGQIMMTEYPMRQ